MISELMCADRLLLDCARSFVTALERLEGSDSTGMLAAQVELDECLHDLRIAAGGSCCCDPGSCPGLISTTRAR